MATSAFARAIAPEQGVWNIDRQLAAAAVDAARVANWQRAGDKRAPRPQPIPRPGVASKPSRRRRLDAEQVAARLADLRERVKG